MIDRWRLSVSFVVGLSVLSPCASYAQEQSHEDAVVLMKMVEAIFVELDGFSTSDAYREEVVSRYAETGIPPDRAIVAICDLRAIRVGSDLYNDGDNGMYMHAIILTLREHLLANVDRYDLLSAVIEQYPEEDPTYLGELNIAIGLIQRRSESDGENAFRDYVQRTALETWEPFARTGYEENPYHFTRFLADTCGADEESTRISLEACQAVERYRKDPEDDRVEMGKLADTLATLSRHEEWWFRAYVAKAIAQRPELRTPEMLQQLAEDEIALVSETIRAIEEQ